MGRTRRVLVVLGLLLAVEGGPPNALASTDRHTNSDWRGTTEQGDVKMRVYRLAPGERAVGVVLIDVSCLCDDGHEGTTQFGFTGGPVVGGHARFRGFVRQVTWTAEIMHERAHGTVHYKTWRCDSGLLKWTAEHLNPPG
jgi:hypothetical protein